MLGIGYLAYARHWGIHFALADPVCWRSRNFWILPVFVFGTGPKTNFFGTLNRARCARQCAASSSPVKGSFTEAK